MKDYEELAEVLFERRDIYIQQQNERRKAMKKTLKRTLTSIGCIALAAALGIGLWQADLFKNSQPNKPAKNESTQQKAENITQNEETTSPTVETEEPNVSSNEEVVNKEPFITVRPEVLNTLNTGGDLADWLFMEYGEIYGYKPNYIDNFPTSSIKMLVDEEIVDNWLNQFWLVSKEPDARYEFWSIMKFLDELGPIITKEQFMTTPDAEEYAEYIDLIFSEDRALRDSTLVSSYAVFAVDRIYPVIWFDCHDAEDYIEAGMTKEQLLEKLELWYETIPDRGSHGVDFARIEAEIEKMPEQAN